MRNEVKTIDYAFGSVFCAILFIVFLVLKLAGFVTWSWWWVTSPLWLPSAVIIIMIFFAVAISVLTGEDE